MCEGLLRTYTHPETGLLPIFNGDDSGFALSQPEPIQFIA